MVFLFWVMSISLLCALFFVLVVCSLFRAALFRLYLLGLRVSFCFGAVSLVVALLCFNGASLLAFATTNSCVFVCVLFLSLLFWFVSGVGFLSSA